MRNTKSLCGGHRFPAIVISCAVRWYYRFQLSLRDIKELLFERGVVVSYETIPTLVRQIWRELCTAGQSGSQHFALKRHLLRASLYRKQLTSRFAASHEFTGTAQNPSTAS